MGYTTAGYDPLNLLPIPEKRVSGDGRDTMQFTSELSPEKELVLLLAEYRSPNKERINELLGQQLDWAEVLGHLVYNRTAGLAYHVIQRCGGSHRKNREVLFGLNSVFEFQVLRARSYRQLIQSISTAMESHGVRHVFLKGSVLTYSIYPMGGRASNDVDLLLPEKDLTPAGNALRALGFVQGSVDLETQTILPATRAQLISHRMNTGEVLPYRKVINETALTFAAVDLNFSLDWVATGSASQVEAFLADTQRYDLGNGQAVQSLSPEAFLAHLCVHLYKEARVHHWVRDQRDLGLYKFVDIYGVITSPVPRINWERFVEMARSLQLTEQCYYAFECTRTFFPVLTEDADFMAALALLRPADTSYLEEIVNESDPTLRYRWSADLLSRFFNLKRHNLLTQIS